MEKICIQDELLNYNLEGKWNDYVGVQKELLNVLRKENFFAESEVTNVQTGMIIKINAKGIKETIGPGMRFQALPKRLKQLKIATLRKLKWIVENAELLHDDIPDYHHEDGYTFAYLEAKIMIDEDVVNIRITVKKKIAVNWFWIHNIDELTSPE